MTTEPPRITRSNMSALQFLEKHQAGGESGLHIGGAHRFGGMMADAAGRAQEQHRNRGDRAENHRIVARAAGHPVDGT